MPIYTTHKCTDLLPSFQGSKFSGQPTINPTSLTSQHTTQFSVPTQPIELPPSRTPANLNGKLILRNRQAVGFMFWMMKRERLLGPPIGYYTIGVHIAEMEKTSLTTPVCGQKGSVGREFVNLMLKKQYAHRRRWLDRKHAGKNRTMFCFIPFLPFLTISSFPRYDRSCIIPFTRHRPPPHGMGHITRCISETRGFCTCN